MTIIEDFPALRVSDTAYHKLQRIQLVDWH